jgi:hypothetical protein
LEFSTGLPQPTQELFILWYFPRRPAGVVQITTWVAEEAYDSSSALPAQPNACPNTDGNHGTSAEKSRVKDSVIGRLLYISEHTVKTHVRSVLMKLDAIGRTEAIEVGIKRGLIKPVS